MACRGVGGVGSGGVIAGRTIRPEDRVVGWLVGDGCASGRKLTSVPLRAQRNTILVPASLGYRIRESPPPMRISASNSNNNPRSWLPESRNAKLSIVLAMPNFHFTQAATGLNLGSDGEAAQLGPAAGHRTVHLGCHRVDVRLGAFKNN